MKIETPTPFDLHKMWRWQMAKNTIVMVLLMVIFKMLSMSFTIMTMAVSCLVAGVLTYIVFWFTKNNMTNEIIQKVGEENVRRGLVNTLLNCLSWFCLSAILYVMNMVHLSGLIK